MVSRRVVLPLKFATRTNRGSNSAEGDHCKMKLNINSRKTMLALVAISVVVVLIISFVLDNPGFVHQISSAMDTLQRIHLPFSGDLPSGGIGQGRNRLAVTEINSFLSARNSSSVSLSAYSENNSWDVCVGANASLGEVEDLLCIPKPDYDPSMTNPCWWGHSTGTKVPKSRASTTSSSSLSCLPYFHILCCSKCGTTDLYNRISKHPDIVSPYKERLYWSWNRYGLRLLSMENEAQPFSAYVNSFGDIARKLRRAAVLNPSDLRRLVTLDASPPDMWEFRGWKKLPQNRNLRHPVVLTPHLMYHLYRDPKFIVLLREPVEKAFTSYLFHRRGESAAPFHKDVVTGIDIMDRCIATAENRLECFFNFTAVAKQPLFLHYGCYAVFFHEWLKVFPRKHFFFLRTEDYSADMETSLLKIFAFLNLPSPSTNILAEMVGLSVSYHTKKKDEVGPMLNKTRALLTKWFKPWNEELAHLLKDDRYLWNDVYATS